MIGVLIVEDSAISREAFERALSASQDFEVVAAIENAANAEIACMRRQIDLVLMDVCTADNESGLVAAAKIKSHAPQVKVIMMTSMPEHSFLQKARACGCDSFWYKEQGDVSLLEACEKTMADNFVWPDQTPTVQIGLIMSDEFTERELEVIRALAQGKRYKEIAEQLYLSPNTIKYHVRNLLQKTGFRSTVELVADVVEKRLILPHY